MEQLETLKALSWFFTIVRPLVKREVRRRSDLGGAMHGVLTVTPSRETKLSKAVDMAVQLKGKGRIADWEPATSQKGIKIILKFNTTVQRRRDIFRDFEIVGYEVTEEEC